MQDVNLRPNYTQSKDEVKEQSESHEEGPSGNQGRDIVQVNGEVLSARHPTTRSLAQYGEEPSIAACKGFAAKAQSKAFEKPSPAKTGIDEYMRGTLVGLGER